MIHATIAQDILNIIILFAIKVDICIKLNDYLNTEIISTKVKVPINSSNIIHYLITIISYLIIYAGNVSKDANFVMVQLSKNVI